MELLSTSFRQGEMYNLLHDDSVTVPEEEFFSPSQKTVLNAHGSAKVKMIASGPKPTSRFATIAANILKIWDAQTAKVLLQFVVHSCELTSVAWGGDLIAVGALDGTIKVFQLEDSDVLRTHLVWRQDAHHDAVCVLAFSPNCSLLVSAGVDLKLHGWRVSGSRIDTEHMFCLTETHFSPITGIAFQHIPNKGNMYPNFVTVGEDRVIRLFETDLGRYKTRANGGVLRRWHDAAITCVASDPLHDQFITGSWDKTIRVWSFDDISCTHVIRDAHRACPTALVHLGKQFVTAAADGSIKIWSAGSVLCQHVITGAHSARVSALVGITDFGVVSSADCDLKLWSVICNTSYTEIFAKQDTSVEARSHGSMAALIARSTSSFGSLGNPHPLAREGQANKRTANQTYAAEVDGPPKTVQGLALANGRLYVATKEFLQEFQPQLDGTWKCTLTLKLLVLVDFLKHRGRIDSKANQITVLSLAVSKDCAYAVFGTHSYGTLMLNLTAATNAVTVFEDVDNDSRRDLGGEYSDAVSAKQDVTSHPVQAVAFSNKGDFLVTAADDLHIRRWEMHDRAILRQTGCHKMKIRGIDVSVDDKLIISCSDDKSIAIWDASNLALKWHLEDAHSRGITKVAFSPQRMSFASVGKDRFTYIRKLEAPDFPVIGMIEDAHVPLHTTELEFDESGFALLTANQLGSVRMWPLNMTPVTCVTSNTCAHDPDQLLARILEGDGETVKLRTHAHKHMSQVQDSFDGLHFSNGHFREVDYVHSNLPVQSRLNVVSPEPQCVDVIPTLLAVPFPSLDSARGTSVNQVPTHLCFGSLAFNQKFAHLWQKCSDELFLDVLEIPGESIEMKKNRKRLHLLMLWFPWLGVSHPLSGKTLCEVAIATKDKKLLQAVMEMLTHCSNYYILSKNAWGVDCFAQCIESNDMDLLKIIMDAITIHRSQSENSRGCDQPLGTHITTKHIQRLLVLKPGLVANFLTQVGREEVMDYVGGGVKSVLRTDHRTIMGGSESPNPHNFWERFLEENPKYDVSAELRKRQQQKHDVSARKKLTQNVGQLLQADSHSREVDVTPFKIGVAQIAGVSDNREDSFLKAILDANHEELFDVPMVSDLLMFKWRKYGKRSYLIEGVYYLTFILFFSAFILVSTGREHHSTARKVFSAILSVIVEGYVARYAIREAKQCKAEGFTDWLLDIWNFSDLILLLLIGGSPILVLTSELSSKHGTLSSLGETFCAIAILLMWLKLLYFGRAFKMFGSLVRMMFEIVKGLRDFMVVLSVAIIGFSFAFYILLHESGDTFAGPGKTLLVVFAMMLGDFELDNFEPEDGGPDHSLIAKILFVLYMMIVFLIMLNVVISIIGDKFDQVQEGARLAWREELARILLEIDQFIPRTAENFPNWLQGLEPVASAGESDEQGWQGKVAAIVGQVEEMLHTHDKKNRDSVVKRLDVLSSKLDHIRKTARATHHAQGEATQTAPAQTAPAPTARTSLESAFMGTSQLSVILEENIAAEPTAASTDN